MVLVFTAKLEAVLAVLPVNDVVEGERAIHVLSVVVLAKAGEGAAVEYESREDGS